MCGRFVLESSAKAIADYLNTEIPEVFASRYNIAPTTPVLAKTAFGLSFFRWGLVPSWARDVSMGNRMFNARAETVSEKPSFKNAFKRRRCLIPASGFYEWHVEDGIKQPYFCHINKNLFSFAGIWELWQDAEGNELQSCSILTTEAVGVMSSIHHRMPVVIDENLHADWLDHATESTDQAIDCIAQLNPNFEIYPVSTQVNSSRNESVDLIKPLL
ncbi:MAG: SOS response-associated peptidase [Gammaproteobacteria bacterium]|jgi:putative SOS response-associated peptidase YedK|nr:SOS response-associated peptidase [Gammaproteobacteria bacterium]MBT3723112.1 SOS response-associated peptidase [Gammaproteobacteria bacterium]MBT4075786.1 SOS response-associated peptidase [Gammaproteobacteria bacterium]MBT4192751.1 SOS response-associated peptidase [Gammaproteobacteria bacterium]MBT4448443.1 SOS response-associated peptidase [Gammaproteobacteria bacterium]